MIFVGIDNGLSGAIVAINNDETILFDTVMPVIGKPKEYNVNEIVRLFKEHFGDRKNLYVALEKAHVRPVSGKRACFSTGEGYGAMKGILGSLGISYIIVTPQAWIKHIIGSSTKDKKPSIMYCQRKYPNHNWAATERSKKISDGLTDACALALYAKRYYIGELK